MPTDLYLLTPNASLQFETILYETAVYSGWERSGRVEEALYRGFAAIALNPGIGHRREDLAPASVRFFYIEPYFVLYVADDLPIRILAIHHGARDIAKLTLDLLGE